VRNDTALLGSCPDARPLSLDIEWPEGRGVLRARRLVLAAGIDGNGRPHVLEPIGALPAGRWCHSVAPFAAERLRGMRIGVVGAATSAFDCAVTALRHGATSVVLLARQPVLRRVEALAWANFPGIMTSLAALDDVRRWCFIACWRCRRLPPPKPSPRRRATHAAHCASARRWPRPGWRATRPCSRPAARNIAWTL